MTAPLAIQEQERPDPDWRSVLEAAGAGPHASPAWIRYRQSRGLTPRYLLVRDATGTVRAAGLAFTWRPRLRFWQGHRWEVDRIPWAAPDTAGHPTVDGDALTETLVAYVRQRGLARLELRSFDAPETSISLTGWGMQESLRYEYVLSLEPEDDARLAAMKSSHRRKLRQAERGGVTVADETAPETALLLHELQGHTRARRADRGEQMDALSRDQATRVGREFVGGGGGRLFVARREGRPLSCALMGVHGGRAYYLMGGTNEEGLGLNAATALMWEAQRALRAAGVRVLNLGGVPARAEQEDALEHGLYRFKVGFGAMQVRCRSGVLDGTPLKRSGPPGR